MVRGEVHGADPFRAWAVAVPVHDPRDGGRRHFCGRANRVLEGEERLEALGKLEFLSELVVGVETVAVVMESRDGRVMRYIVCSMADGSHICSCRTLQELGLCYRHFWQAMRLSPNFKKNPRRHTQ